MMNKRAVRLLTCIMCVVFLAQSLSGCQKENGTIEEGKTYIYYTDKKITKLVPEEYKIKADDEDGKVEELLKELQLNTDNVEILKAIPNGVEVSDYELEDGVLSLSFNVEYLSMSKPQEILTRAAVVFTMTQLPEVSYVSISVAGQPLTKSGGEVVGNMQASDFADNLDNNKEVSNTSVFTIYYANLLGTALLPYTFEAEYGSNISREQFIINKLLEGPGEEEGYLRTISNNVQVVNVQTIDNICYVTFGENFLTEQVSVPEHLVIYSIVNSLSEISYIHRVQIVVNGVADATYHGTVSLAEPFTRNLDYVEKEENAE